MATPKRRVLVVDSDPSLARSLRQEVSERVFEVDTADTPDAAILRVAAAPPDMVVLDLNLPNGAALKLLRLWRTDSPGLAVILVSGNASLTTVVEALKEGARGFFTKAIGAAALIEALEPRAGCQPSLLEPFTLANHQLGIDTLKAEGVDRFFALCPGLMSVAGFDGYFKMLNPAWEQVLGYSMDELCSKPYLELVHPDDREKATGEALEIRGGKTVFRFKNRYRCKDGSYRWLAWCSTPSPSQGLIYGSARDVTNSVRREQGLRESVDRLKHAVMNSKALLLDSSVRNDTLAELVRFKDGVSGMIVHDLRSPLAVILANHDYVLEEFEGSTDCREALEDSQGAGRRMLRLLSNLGDVARLEEGTLAVNVSKINLPRLIHPLIEQRRVLVRAQKISMVLLPSPEINGTLDADLVTRTLENVLDNALRYTPVGGSIEIALREIGSTVEIRIGNSGPRIPIESRHAIFERHGQIGFENGRGHSGLGLYFCLVATAAQGGRIWVEETERLPTVFCIRLPMNRILGEKA